MPKLYAYTYIPCRRPTEYRSWTKISYRCTRICKCICMRICMYMHMHMYMHVCMYVYAWNIPDCFWPIRAKPRLSVAQRLLLALFVELTESLPWRQRKATPEAIEAIGSPQAPHPFRSSPLFDNRGSPKLDSSGKGNEVWKQKKD